ncbi:alpha/beta fold hydrolase [Herbiconiux solani]|uniref:alpha/beta fold hydrolase n=1 Tax=Herbiconiux solani TaxID=661329 RepID=UPI000AFC7E35|nr:alpha/beta hydrolase [Herbiconiux solani]
MNAPIPNAPALSLSAVTTNGTTLNVASGGEGPAVLLMHGFPHTWRVWSPILDGLAAGHRVIAPDLRGLGDSARASDGYDAGNLARDMRGVLEAFGETSAVVVGLDAGGPPAFLLGLEHPELVDGLVLIESTIGRLPGADEFFRAGPPWWFGFHAVPGLAESVLAGQEEAYVDFFLRIGTADGKGIDAGIRDAFVEAYRRPDSLRCAFEYYRAMPTSARQIDEAVRRNRLTVPTLTVGGGVVGDATTRQLGPIADDLTSRLISTSGHIVPLDAPEELAGLLKRFLDGLGETDGPDGLERLGGEPGQAARAMSPRA